MGVSQCVLHSHCLHTVGTDRFIVGTHVEFNVFGDLAVELAVSFDICHVDLRQLGLAVARGLMGPLLRQVELEVAKCLLKLVPLELLRLVEARPVAVIVVCAARIEGVRVC